MVLPVYCEGCQKVFSSCQYFQRHIEANEVCAAYFVCRLPPRPDGLSRMTPQVRAYRNSGETTEEFVGRAAQFLEEEEREKIARGNATYSEFEFTDDENPGPQKRIRVGELKDILQRTGVGGSNVELEEGNVDLIGDQQMETEEATNPVGPAAVGGGGVPNAGVETVEPNPNAGTEAAAGENGTRIKTQFEEYCERARKKNGNFSPEMKAAIELMHMMNESGGSVTLYDLIFEWHLKHRHVDHSVSSEQLHKRLIDRNNLGPCLPFERSVELPHSKEVVKIPCQNFSAQVRDLLTDPRWTDEDYLFHSNDPMANPPEEWTKVGDVNTSLAHRKTWDQLIAPQPFTRCGRKKVLCAVHLYFDGTMTSKFGNTSLEIVKFTLGIFNGKARNKDFAWRYLGFVRKITKRLKAAQENIKDSGHIDADGFLEDPDHRGKQFKEVRREGPLFDQAMFSPTPRRRRRRNKEPPKKKPPQLKIQDLHAMVTAVLDSYKDIENENGFPWDLRYKGDTHKLWFIPYIHIVKVDSKEADKFCGAYGTNLEGVKCICRMCCLPAEQSDQVYFEEEPQRKTQDLILDLVKQNTDDSRKKLKNMSQHELWNCFYRHRFGLHNNAGIHGATPMETLHWIQLNTYKFNREAFFLQTGVSSKLSDKIDALTQTYGICLGRQSDRDMPRTRFADGIRGGLMQANEMTGVMLLLALSIRSTRGRNYLRDDTWGNSKVFFEQDIQIENWIRMLELHLCFEQWLRKEEHDVSRLKRAQTKVKEMMSMTKHVGQRSKGRQYKVQSFHTTLHMPTLAMELGAPTHWNVESQEGHHKKDKKTADRTNKQFETFDVSCNTKCVQRHAVELAMEELQHGLKRWNYHWRGKFKAVPAPEPFDSIFTGPSVSFELHPEDNTLEYKIHSKMVGADKYTYDRNTFDFIHTNLSDLWNDNGVSHFTAFGTLKMYSPTAESKSQLFHAMPYSQGRPWNDWAMFDLSDPESVTPEARNYVPAQIKCFLDLTHIPHDNALLKPPGMYAIIEPAKPSQEADDLWWSSLWDPICKDPCTVPGFEGCNKQELVSIDRILQTAIVVPDFDHPNKRSYLRMVPKKLWAAHYDFWLDQPHQREFE